MRKYYKYKILKMLGLVSKEKFQKKIAKYTVNYKAIARSKHFDKKWYLEQNPDVKKLGIDPVQHYLTQGWKEGKNPSKNFDGDTYLNTNLDVKTAKVNPLLHYEKFSKKEGRSCELPKPHVFPVGTESYVWESKSKPSCESKRVAIFASYSVDGTISDAVIYYLRGLKEVVDSIIFIADNPVFLEEVNKIKDIVCYAQFERHEEYDFGSYKRGYIYAKNNGLLDNAEELVVCNDSCYGPIYPFGDMFDSVKNTSCDFWGFSINQSFQRHIQSFFYVFKKQVFTSQVFENFLLSVKKEIHVSHVIINYEIPFTTVLHDAGFQFTSFIPENYEGITTNLTFYPNTLIQQCRAPLIKVKCFSSPNVIKDNSTPDSLVKVIGAITKELAVSIIKKHNIVFECVRTRHNKSYVISIIKAIRKLFGNNRTINVKKILLISHQLSYTGAPISLLTAAKCLKSMGHSVDVYSLKDGPLSEEFKSIGCKCFIKKNSLSNYVLLFRSIFYDVCIVNTLIPYNEYCKLKSILPTALWIRESSNLLIGNPQMERCIENAKHIYTMSDFSKNEYQIYNENIKIIKHGFEDKYRSVTASRNISFAVVGTIESRKGQDIFIDAINLLSEKLRAQAKFKILGKIKKSVYMQDLIKSNVHNVEFIDQIQEEKEMLRFYEAISCVIVPSRQEPTSRVAIEAMMMGRPVIMSNMVGAQYLLKHGQNGFIFETENAQELASYMEEIILNPSRLPHMGNCARQAFLEHNSIDQLKKGLHKMLIDVTTETSPLKLTLVIPVYNAPDDVKKCLDSVVKNFNREHEFIIVDDCSERETEDFLQNFAKEHSFVTLYRNQENLGFVKTCNFAMQKAKNGIIVLLNSDTIIPSNFCEKIVECFEKNPNVGVACPIPSNSGHFSLELPDNMNIEQMSKFLCAKHKTEYPLLPSCNGFCFCIRKVVTEVIGFFDEVYGRGYHEEVDFCFRAISSGYQCCLIDNLYVMHKRHASFGSKQREELIKKNNIVFNERWKGFAKNWEEKHNYSNPVERIQQELFPEPFKFFKKIKTTNGRRRIYFCGIKIFSYRH